MESGSLKKTGTVISDMSLPILPLIIYQSPGRTFGSFKAGNSTLSETKLACLVFKAGLSFTLT